MFIKKAFKDCDKILLFITIILCMFGLFNIVTVSSQEVTNKMVDESIYYYFYRQLSMIIIGLVPSLIIMFLPLKRLYKYIPILFIGAVVLNIMAIIYGGFTRGATNWLPMGPIKFQPSEFSKPILILTVAFLFEFFQKPLQNPKTDHEKIIFIILIAGFLIPAIVFVQKDIGTCAIIAGSFLAMFIFSPLSKKDKIFAIKWIGVAILCLALFYVLAKGSLLSGAQSSRLNYFNPCQTSKYKGEGYQVCNAFIAINRGKLTGVGIGKSTQKYSYIPEPHTDMVFAIISEEYGFIVGLLIILCYVVIIWRVLKLATYASTLTGRYICLGVATFIFLHVFINLGGMFGLIPLTGVPLPFLSYGGSFVIALLVSLALVQRVHIDTKRAKII
ncbi:MAG: FtsW/RodA/SpoVE family cell cycle protein [Bacilli bacterium]|nr:FtsW/RodA/SpoVE family cell cycle protein [Bacilli bacterium]